MKRCLAIALLFALSSVLVAQVSAPQRVRVGTGVMQGLLAKKVAPQYPAEAKAARIQGSVVLRAIIDKQGNVANLQLISGHPMLAPAAIEAVKQWKYAPYLLNGEPVEVETNITVNFTLADDGNTNDTAAASDEKKEEKKEEAQTPDSNSAPHPVAVPTRVRVSSGVSQGLLAKKVAPAYPDEARTARIQGTVILNAIIDKEGNVANLQLVSGHPILAPAAIEAVKQWKYRPYLFNNQPVEVATQIQVNFTLSQ